MYFPEVNNQDQPDLVVVCLKEFLEVHTHVVIYKIIYIKKLTKADYH